MRSCCICPSALSSPFAACGSHGSGSGSWNSPHCNIQWYLQKSRCLDFSSTLKSHGVPSGQHKDSCVCNQPAWLSICITCCYYQVSPHRQAETTCCVVGPRLLLSAHCQGRSWCLCMDVDCLVGRSGRSSCAIYQHHPQHQGSHCIRQILQPALCCLA